MNEDGILRGICSGVVAFGSDVDADVLPGYLAEGLWQIRARDVGFDENRVWFKGGPFRVVWNTNLLVAFGRGELTVATNERAVRYVLSFRQYVAYSTLGIAVMAVFVLVAFPVQWPIILLPAAWVFGIASAVFVGVVRFRWFLRRLLAEAPRQQLRANAAWQAS